MTEYITIYEQSVTGSNLWHLSGIFSFVIFGFAVVFFTRRTFKSFSFFRQLVLFIGWAAGIMGLILLMVFFTKIPEILKNERELKTMMQNETYLTVEGLTEGFTAPQEGSDHFESFTVNGVGFRYSDYIMIRGYHTTSSKGGAISRNGLQVRIGYRQLEGENIILKLEIADPGHDSSIQVNEISQNDHTSCEVLPDGIYRFDIAFAEWEGKTMGETVTIEIYNNSIKVIYDGDGLLTRAQKGEVIDQGIIMKHKSGAWIIGKNPADAQLDEIGGCTGGPAIIDFANMRYWMC